MAQGATIHVFQIELANSDRGVYETLDLRVACHPSEAADHLLARVIAYCLEYTPGIGFSKGLSDPDEPAIAVRTHKDPVQLIARLRGERIHRGEALELYAFDRDWLAAIERRLERRMQFALTVASRHLYLSLGADMLESSVQTLSLA
jgi:uncharacterized protein YaeQ